MLDKKFETIAIRTQVPRTEQREHSVPIYLTSSFIFENAEQARALFADEIQGNIYSRFSNPNTNEFIEKLCLLEGAEDGIATASGMAAIFLSFASFLKTGDHILVCKSIFGSTHQIISHILPRWGISFSFFKVEEYRQIEHFIQKNTKIIFLETPSNPSLDVIDIEYVAQIANRHNIILNVDNCFATPYIQQPIKWGAHIVTHSATKFIDGQGRVVAGAVLGNKELIKEIRFMARHIGPALSPFNAWILSKSLETLAVRMERHCENAQSLAKYLCNRDDIEIVKYPFLDSYPHKNIAQKQMK